MPLSFAFFSLYFFLYPQNLPYYFRTNLSRKLILIIQLIFIFSSHFPYKIVFIFFKRYTKFSSKISEGNCIQAFPWRAFQNFSKEFSWSIFKKLMNLDEFNKSWKNSTKVEKFNSIRILRILGKITKPWEIQRISSNSIAFVEIRGMLRISFGLWEIQWILRVSANFGEINLEEINESQEIQLYS